MTCAACVRNVERAISKVNGILAVNVNLATEHATLQYIPGTLDRQTIVQAIQKAGYDVVNTTPLREPRRCRSPRPSCRVCPTTTPDPVWECVHVAVVRLEHVAPFHARCGCHYAGVPVVDVGGLSVCVWNPCDPRLDCAWTAILRGCL
ncbi:MAG UNVERIFIED_CONTAM: heavy-metal-associated domain-containing protein [Anaerolineae bacterium]